MSFDRIDVVFLLLKLTKYVIVIVGQLVEWPNAQQEQVGQLMDISHDKICAEIEMS